MKKIISLLVSIFLFSMLTQAQYQVGTQNLNVQDPARSNRTINYEVCYPAMTAGANATIATGQFPVIVFGHGFGIAVSEYDVWCNAFASKGYIMIFPTTEGSVFPFPNHEQFSLDLSFLVDHFLGASTPFPGSILGTSAIMGHSMGGGASWAATAGNPNVTTMVTLAAAETNAPVSSIGAAPSITVPTLTLAGTSDCVVMAGGAPIDMYNALPTGPFHTYIDIIGGSHCQFGAASGFSICTTGEFCGGFIPIADQHNQMLTLTCNWMDYYLKDDCQAFLDLQDYIDTNEGTLHNSMEMGTEPVTACSSCANLDLDITFDGWANQTSWDIVDANNNVVASSGAYSTTNNGSALTEQTCLPDGCYTFNMYDSYGNGMCPKTFNAYSQTVGYVPGGTVTGSFGTIGISNTAGRCGNYKLYDASGTLILSGGLNFGASETQTFCLTGGVATKTSNNQVDLSANKNFIVMQPTLVSNFINIEFGFTSEANVLISIYNINGKLIQQKNHLANTFNNAKLEVSTLQKGTYLVQVITPNEIFTKRFVKN